MLTRFAPSPTGHLHLGHIYAAKVARDTARAAGGKYLLRFEDIDTTRARPEFYSAILEDLDWLNLSPDATPIRQSDRASAYAIALEKLKSLGVVYPCFCTRKQIEQELASITNAPHGPEGALYPQTCRNLTEEQISTHISAGEIPSWRIHTHRAAELSGELTFNDKKAGITKVNPHLLGDVILARKDIGTSYHIAVVVDDAFQNITHITRGEDLLHATHLHRVLQKILHLPEPQYYHHPLVCDQNGKRLATRDKAMSIRTLREEGKSPEQILKMIPQI